MLLCIKINDLEGKKCQTRTLKSFRLDERKLQNVLFHSLSNLVPDTELLVLMQSTYGKEEPDLMAIDKNGDLFIFELKAWESESENLLQVLRYGQLFGGKPYKELDDLFKKRTAASQSLKIAHKAKFDIELLEEEFNRKQIFVLITNGMDWRTREAVQYWKKCGLDVRPWIYRVFNGYTADEMLLEITPFRVDDDPYEDISSGFYLLNTNYGTNPEDQEEMLAEHKAAAFFDPWKFQITRLKRGDRVFLYQNGKGIVAYGEADGKLLKSPYHDDTDAEDTYSMRLNQFKRVTPPLTAAEIKKIKGSSHPFLQTMSALDNESGEKIIKEIAAREFAPALPTSVSTAAAAASSVAASSSNNVIIAMKKAIHQETGKKSMSSFTVGCLTGDLYNSKSGVVIPVTIMSVTQQKFEEDLKQFADLLKCMKLPITLIFAAGGTLKLPSWFRELCAALGITIIILESEHQVPNMMSGLYPPPLVRKVDISMME